MALCPRYTRAMEILGKRWNGLVLRALLGAPLRFSAMTTMIAGISDRMLSERLKELEAEGLVIRQVYPETPVRIEYSLTAKGEDLAEVLDAIQRWADKWEGGFAQEAGPGATLSRTGGGTHP